MNREILDHLLAAATVYLTLHAAERFGWQRALPLGAVLGLGILGNVRLEGLPIVLGAYLLWRTGISRRTVLATARSSPALQSPCCRGSCATRRASAAGR